MDKNLDKAEPKWFIPDRSRFKDAQGRYITQSLFLEEAADINHCMYTLSDTDKEREGIIYPSLRRLYLETGDPTEYTFAVKYLWGWDHWQRILNNVVLYENYIVKWRDELEVKLRARGARALISLSETNFAAARAVSRGEWSAVRGRPSNKELERERKIRTAVATEIEADSARVLEFIKKGNK